MRLRPISCSLTVSISQKISLQHAKMHTAGVGVGFIRWDCGSVHKILQLGNAQTASCCR